MRITENGGSHDGRRGRRRGEVEMFGIISMYANMHMHTL